MTQWDYKTIDLWRGEYPELNSTAAAYDSFQEKLRQAGDEGWEAVGQITISWMWKPRTGGNYPQTIPSLLLKRPRS